MSVDFSKPLRTRDGAKATFLREVNHNTYPMLVLVDTHLGQIAYGYNREGRYSENYPHSVDIENVPEPPPEPECVWMNVYRVEGGRLQFGGVRCIKKDQAKAMSGPLVVGCNRITPRAEFDE